VKSLPGGVDGPAARDIPLGPPNRSSCDAGLDPLAESAAAARSHPALFMLPVLTCEVLRVFRHQGTHLRLVEATYMRGFCQNAIFINSLK
jgi:hypothetical protein